MHMDLKEKVVLVTGSSAGIGKETALAFSKKGCRTVVTYNSGREEGEKVHQECSRNSESLFLQLDVTSSESIRKAVEDTVKKFGRLDILVNNAGIIRWKHLIEQEESDIEAQIDVDLKGLIKMTRKALPTLHRQKEGMIINIASMAGKRGYAELTVYCAAKFGVRGFTRALAKELPDGIRTYCVNPGMTATKMTGFKGVPPSEVAGIIIRTAEERLDKSSGEDVDVPDYL
ncbi:SDR family NAD(P)-dependent oxidoreductase [Candidatus Micrarchaeota archaeon]|nr:SDR family NAD(P)-dependent oxidoreductase [Candidatus Micrarchaeota archaeon]